MEEVEAHIQKNGSWEDLPNGLKQLLGHSKEEYLAHVKSYCLKRQLRWDTTMVRTITTESGYYHELLDVAQANLMLYPYHLSDMLVKLMKVTPFQYYHTMLFGHLLNEKAFATIPNFTAADSSRILGIGRNEFIDIMNRCKSKGWMWKTKKKTVLKDNLPPQPVDKSVEYWWIINHVPTTQEEVKSLNPTLQHEYLSLLKKGPREVGEMNRDDVLALYRFGLVWFDVPVTRQDYIVVPPLEGFVMNRVSNDFFEKLLYDVFVSMDEHTNLEELAQLLQKDFEMLKDVIQLFLRLGFAKKKGYEGLSTVEGTPYHSSWISARRGVSTSSTATNRSVATQRTTRQSAVSTASSAGGLLSVGDNENLIKLSDDESDKEAPVKRIGLLFDASLTAFLMMGNLSEGLKRHAVTMFEVGKLSDEAMEEFLDEMDKIKVSETSHSEGDVQRYFEHAINLRTTLRALRHNCGASQTTNDLPLDLVRSESLNTLDSKTRSRVLKKNYQVIVSICPIPPSNLKFSCVNPVLFGPCIPEINSSWFKLYMYHLTSSGPPTVLFVKGARPHTIPPIFRGYKKVVVQTWGTDEPMTVALSNLLETLHASLMTCPVLVQAYVDQSEEEDTIHDIAFPFGGSSQADELKQHPAVLEVYERLGLSTSCGYIRLIKQVSREKQSVMSSFLPFLTLEPLSTNHLPPSHPPKCPDNAPSTSSSARSLITSTTSPDAGAAPNLMDSPLEVKVDRSRGVQLSKEWLLLDVKFGIPLFDKALNESVCASIEQESLFQEDNLSAVEKHYQRITTELTSFIASHLPDMELDSDGQTVVLPSANVVFDGRRVQIME